MSEASDLLHKVWGQAKASPEYDKAVLKNLQAAITNLELGEPNRIRELKAHIVQLQQRALEHAMEMIVDCEHRGGTRYMECRICMTTWELGENVEHRPGCFGLKAAEATIELDNARAPGQLSARIEELERNERVTMDSVRELLPDEAGISCAQEALHILAQQRDRLEYVRKEQLRLNDLEREATRRALEQVKTVEREQGPAKFRRFLVSYHHGRGFGSTVMNLPKSQPQRALSYTQAFSAAVAAAPQGELPGLDNQPVLLSVTPLRDPNTEENDDA